MIHRVTGRLVDVHADAAIVEVAGLAYELLIPGSSYAELHARVGQDLTLHTVYYLEGNPAGSHLAPRLLGFLSEAERDFFRLFTRVKGISSRRALRAMAVPYAQLAAAIEHGDSRFLTTLPEVGKKTAEQIIAELRGQCTGLLAPSAAAAATAPVEMTDAQRIAVDILVQWGDRRADAVRWVAAAVVAAPELSQPEEIVRAAYRAKTAIGG